jgi:hypothetical protein
MAGEPDAAHDIHLPDVVPLLVGDIRERPRFEDTGVVYKNVQFWPSFNQSVDVLLP